VARHKDRREALHIIGAIGSTCAFPFSSDQLFAQHQHPAGTPAPAAAPAAPVSFNAAEFAILSRMADLIIPATDSPGALAAGVPAYIDLVAQRNSEAKRLCVAGTAWLDRQSKKKHGKSFLDLAEAEQVDLLTPLCREADQQRETPPGSELKKSRRPALPVAFFRTVKSLTSDGFFTSQAGLVDTLRYPGNSVHAAFPECIHEH